LQVYKAIKVLLYDSIFQLRMFFAEIFRCGIHVFFEQARKIKFVVESTLIRNHFYGHTAVFYQQFPGFEETLTQYKTAGRMFVDVLKDPYKCQK
jgi:hypothetical protein